MIFLYDGSFEGFLSAVFDAILVREEVRIEKKSGFQPLLFEETREVETTQEKAERVSGKIIGIVGKYGFSSVVYIFLSELPGCETLAFHLIKVILKRGVRAFSLFQDEKVAEAMNMRRKVSKECERMTGLMRFSELASGWFYAPFEPDHNIITLIFPHFYERLSGTRWMIHDLRRGIALCHEDGRAEPVEFADEATSHKNMGKLLGVSGEEKEFSGLWSDYFRIIAIESRINPKLQKRCMPQRYWKYLTERKNEVSDFKV